MKSEALHNVLQNSALDFSVKSRKSKKGTFQLLCVICSTLDLTQSSATSHTHCHFTIHNILPINSQAFNTHCICGASFGIFGAGGRTGKSRFTSGMTIGSVGNCGGIGKFGISGSPKSRLKSNHALGGLGRFGILGNGILVGLNLNVGSRISIHISILERSR